LSFARFVDTRATARATGTSLAASSRAPGHRSKPKTMQTPCGRVANRHVTRDHAPRSVPARAGADRRAGLPALPHL